MKYLCYGAMTDGFYLNLTNPNDRRNTVAEIAAVKGASVLVTSRLFTQVNYSLDKLPIIYGTTLVLLSGETDIDLHTGRFQSTMSLD
jgi:hypothetical protein